MRVRFRLLRRSTKLFLKVVMAVGTYSNLETGALAIVVIVSNKVAGISFVNTKMFYQSPNS